MFVYSQVYFHFLDKGRDLLSVTIKWRWFVQSEFSWVVVISGIGNGDKRVQVGVENEADRFCLSSS